MVFEEKITLHIHDKPVDKVNRKYNLFIFISFTVTPFTSEHVGSSDKF